MLGLIVTVRRCSTEEGTERAFLFYFISDVLLMELSLGFSACLVNLPLLEDIN